MDKRISVLLVFIILITPVFTFNVTQAEESVIPLSDGNFPYPGDDWAWKMVGADLAHELGETGEGVRIAVLDTGIDYTHPDLEDKMWEEIGYDFVNDNDDPMDVDGHGTHVAGIIASVAPDAELMALKVIEKEGGRWQEVSQAVRFARDNGADIITMSFGGDQSPLARAFERQINFAYDEGIYLTAAAGNDGTDSKHYPAAYDAVAAVSAVNHEKEKTDYSNYGDWLDLTAPGGDTEMRVFSTIPNEKYGNKAGTSMSTPFVAGVAAIKLGANPGITGRQVREQINQQAVDLSNPEYYGYGLVNAYLAAGGEVPSYPENVRGSSENERAIVRWEQPRFEGLAPIEEYNLYRSSDGGLELINTFSNDTFEHADTDVSNEITYTYKLTAVNEYGESSYSTPIYLTPRESPVEPSEVRELHVVSNEAPVELTWSEPMDDGGSPIINYNVYRDGELVGQPEETYYVDQNARGDVTYTVSATNEVGEGPLSEPVEVSVISDDQFTPEKITWPLEPIIPLETILDWWIFAAIGILSFVLLSLLIYAAVRKPKGPVY